MFSNPRKPLQLVVGRTSAFQTRPEFFVDRYFLRLIPKLQADLNVGGDGLAVFSGGLI